MSAVAVLLVSYRQEEDDFTQFVSEKLLRYRQLLPVEKAYLHFDKPYYAAGDTLWFKAYLVEGTLHVPDSTGSLLYVDLVNRENGTIAALRRVEITGGVGQGELVLADSIRPGSYTLRAYTNWMRNFPEEFFFRSDIKIWNHQEPVQLSGDTTKPDLQFFPEGGQLVEGLKVRTGKAAM